MASVSNAINMSFRVDKDLKQQADKLFKSMGMNTSVALNMFLTQCVRDQALAFKPTMEKPNRQLLEAIKEVEAIESGQKEVKSYNNFEEALVDLDK